MARKTSTRHRAKPPATPRRSLRKRALRILEDWQEEASREAAERERRREEEAHRDPFPLEHFYDLLRRRLGVMPQECERTMMDEDTFYADVDGLRFSASRFDSQGLLWYHKHCVVCGGYDRSPVPNAFSGHVLGKKADGSSSFPLFVGARRTVPLPPYSPKGMLQLH
jgi:hypothetical protein